jgi:esterase/lipase superfamily enzyme
VLELGVCEVSIPPDHRVGHVESPSILRLEFREDPEKHVVLQRTVRLELDKFYASLKETIDESPNAQALVFIHGYNVGFDSAVKRTAQIVYDLKFQGAAVCYSWPSNAGIADYTRDEANVGWTVTQLEGFLRDLAARSGANTIHLIAHSMGNRALLAAIERMSLRRDSPQFGQVILAAPDVDAGEFRTRYAPALANTARQVTLYASSNDRALIASTKVHGYTRAGLSGENLMVTPGVETIDVSPIDTSLIGHSYYGDNPQLIRDLVAMIDQNLRAANREWLERDVLEEAEFYWSFRELE